MSKAADRLEALPIDLARAAFILTDEDTALLRAAAELVRGCEIYRDTCKQIDAIAWACITEPLAKLQEGE